MTTPTGTTNAVPTEVATLRRRVEELEQALDTARRMLDAAPNLLYLYALQEQRNIYTNRGLAEMPGYSSGELIQGSETMLPDLMHPEDVARLPAYLEACAALADRETLTFEHRMRDANGEWHWLLRRDTVFKRNADGTASQLFGTVHDIDAWKRAEDERQQNYTLLQAIIDNVPAVISVQDLDERLLLVNQQWTVTMGCSFAEAAARDASTMFPAEALNEWRRRNRQVIATGQVISFEEVVSLPDGTHAYASAQFPLKNEQGTVYAVGSVSIDITHQKRIEEELRMFRALVESSPDGVVVFAPRPGEDEHVLYSNPAFQQMLGYTAPPSVISQAAMHADDLDRMVEVERICKEQGYWRGSLRYTRQDGSIFPGWLTTFGLQDQQGQFQAAVGIIRDITEQQRLEEERASLQQRVIDAQRDALRELSTPLIPIADHVVIMPLIGTLDSGRAQMVMETLLEGVAAHQAAIAILDITGVQVIDTQVANGLIRAAQAVKLLGAQVILTGIQPRIAQTLVHLGIDLSGIITRGTLQAGIGYALAQVDLAKH